MKKKNQKILIRVLASYLFVLWLLASYAIYESLNSFFDTILTTIVMLNFYSGLLAALFWLIIYSVNTVTKK